MPAAQTIPLLIVPPVLMPLFGELADSRVRADVRVPDATLAEEWPRTHLHQKIIEAFCGVDIAVRHKKDLRSNLVELGGLVLLALERHDEKVRKVARGESVVTGPEVL